MVDQLSTFLKHANKVHEEIAEKSPAHSVVTASWRRSMLHHGITPSEKNLARRLSGREFLLVKQKLEFFTASRKSLLWKSYFLR